MVKTTILLISLSLMTASCASHQELLAPENVVANKPVNQHWSSSDNEDMKP